MIRRDRTREVLLALLGVVGLLMKSRLARSMGPLVHEYGGNVTASFAAFFVLKLPEVPNRFRVIIAASAALLATEVFEVTDGFGFMSNTYDPGDYLANAVGVALALAVEGAMVLASRLRESGNEEERVTKGLKS